MNVDPLGAMRTGTGSSFTEFLSVAAPHLLPGAAERGGDLRGIAAGADVPHGTTIVSLTYDGGMVMAGDRRATMGNLIAQKDIEKVFTADSYSLVGIAGAAGLAVELVRLFQVELEHYEKLEGVPLTLDGKANRLASMIRGNLALAMQGLAVVPMFGGFDVDRGRGRMFSFDVTGGRYEERDFHAVGSGSLFARGSLKKLYAPDLSRDNAVAVAIEALVDAADDDSATGGPDQARGLYPTIGVADVDGALILAEGDVVPVVDAVMAARRSRPDGPRAALPPAVGGGA